MKSKYNYDEIQKLIDIGNSYRSLKKILGISSKTLWAAQKKGLIKFPKNNQKKLLAIGVIKPHPCSSETKEKLSKLMSKRIKKNIRYSKMENYKGVWLDSSYESIVVRELELNNIQWIRPKALKWDDNGQIRRYLPDFFLPDYNVYLDPKNDYLIKKDKIKIERAMSYNSVTVIVLSKHELKWVNILNKIPR